MRARALARRRPASAIISALVFLGCVALVPIAAPAPALAGGCPNEQVRGESNTSPSTGKPYSTELPGFPDCRAYEMVSPLYKNGQNARGLQLAEGGEGIPVAPDGNTVGFLSIGAFSNPRNYVVQKLTPLNPYVALREPSGWRTIASAPPAELLYHPFEEGLLGDLSPDLHQQLSCGLTEGGSAQLGCGVGALGGPWKFGTPLYRFAGGSVDVNESKGYLGASRDFSRVFVAPGVPLRPSDSNISRGSIYEIAGVGGGSPRLRLVNVDNAGNELEFNIPSGEGPLLGASGVNTANGTSFHAISEDAKTVYFTAAPHGGEKIPTLFARIQCEPEPASKTCTEDNEGLSAGEKSHEFFETVAVASPAPSCAALCNPEAKPATFQGASADGSKVFFTTEQQLLPQDTNATYDLYEYRFHPGPGEEHLVQISAGEEEASVRGVVRTSADGSHVYFIASGVLTTTANGNEEKAQAGKENLYGYDTETGVMKFVADVSGQSVLGCSNGLLCNDELGSDAERHAQTTPDGRYLVFSTPVFSPEELKGTGYTGPGSAVFRYDFSTGALVWVSHGAPEYKAKCEAELETQAKGQWSASVEYTVGQAVEQGGIHYEALKASTNVQPPEPTTWKEITLAEYEVKEQLVPKSTLEKEKCEKEGKEALITPLFDSGASKSAPGAPGGSEADSEDWNRAISENGEYIIFTTRERLQVDHEDGVQHVYEWHNDGHNGIVGKISVGDPNEPIPPALGMSATGSDIFFFSRAQLVGQDTDGLIDLYDARIGGGFPAPPPEPSCSGEACQGPGSTPPSFGTAASSLSAAGGNLPPGTIVGGGGAQTPIKPASKPPTRAQQLAKALKTCRAEPRKKRITCEAQARKRYGVKAKSRGHRRGRR